MGAGQVRAILPAALLICVQPPSFSPPVCAPAVVGPPFPLRPSVHISACPSPFLFSVFPHMLGSRRGAISAHGSAINGVGGPLLFVQRRFPYYDRRRRVQQNVSICSAITSRGSYGGPPSRGAVLICRRSDSCLCVKTERRRGGG